MSRRKPVILGCLIVAIVGLSAAAVGIVLFVRRLPDVAAQIPPLPMVVTLSEPLNGSVAALHGTLEVSSQAVAETPIQWIELWADGNLISQALVPEPAPRASASWFWAPDREGDHHLVTRAVDSLGRTGQSNVVRVTVTANADVLFPFNYSTISGDSLEVIAANFGAEAEAIVQSNPAVDFSGPLPEGSELTLPIPGLPGPLEGPAVAPPSVPQGSAILPQEAAPTKLGIWFEKTFLPPPSHPPDAPALEAQASGCAALLSIHHPGLGESGFRVFRLDEASAEFELIATLGPANGDGVIQYADEAASGHLEYFVSAFNLAGESISAIQPVDLTDPSCPAADSEAPDFVIIGSKVATKKAVDRLYLYLSINSGPWHRVPDNPKEFMLLTQGTFDLALYLDFSKISSPVPVPYVVEAWGWYGADLIYLGRDTGLIVPAPEGVSPFAQTHTSTLEVELFAFQGEKHFTTWPITISAAGELNRELRWTGEPFSGTYPAVTDGLWQVSTLPFPPGPMLNPPGLIATGMVAAPQVETAEVSTSTLGLPDFPDSIFTATSHFAIDLSQFLELEQDRGLPSPTEPADDQCAGSTFFPEFLCEAMAGFEQALAKLPGYFPRTFFVRVIPFAGNHPSGQPTNTLIVSYGPPDPPQVGPNTGAAYEARILSTTPYRKADPAYAACWVVTEDFYGYSMGYENGEIVNKWGLIFHKGQYSCGCPGVDCGCSGLSCVSEAVTDFFTGVFEGVSKVAGAAAKLYNWLKQQAVEFALNYTAMGLQCKLAADLGGDLLSEDDCRVAAEIALDAGLVALGVPPSIPDFEEFLDKGIDYAVEVAAEELRAKGIECNSLCEDILKEGIELARDQFDPSTGTGTGSGQAVWLKQAPHPLAQEHLPTVVLEITRRYQSAGIPREDLTSCAAVVNNLAVNPNLPVSWSGKVFEPATIKIPPLELGESVTVPVTLRMRPVGDVVPGSAPQANTIGGVVGGALGGLAHPLLGDWDQVYYGSQITFTLQGPSFSTTSTTGNAISLPCVQGEGTWVEQAPKKP